jgi:hypothetical protein
MPLIPRSLLRGSSFFDNKPSLGAESEQLGIDVSFSVAGFRA